MGGENYYEVLGVPKNADKVRIKKAYRRLALQFHPDRNPGDKHAERRFKLAAEAYAVLHNPITRKQYDRYGYGSQKGCSSAEDVFKAFSNTFCKMFNCENRAASGLGVVPDTGTQPQGEPEISPHIKQTIIFAPEDLARGGRVLLKVAQQTFCPTCDGHGGLTGAVFHPCPTCVGSGRSIRVKELEIFVPPGVTTNTTLRVRGEGNQCHPKEAPGDLYVQIRLSSEEEHDGLFADHTTRVHGQKKNTPGPRLRFRTKERA